ncbi:hypothetical protein F4V89_28630, partial [Neorhizobium galegae]
MQSNQELFDNLAKAKEIWHQVAPLFNDAINAYRHFDRENPGWRSELGKFVEQLNTWRRAHEASEALSITGWLYHPSLPPSVIQGHLDDVEKLDVAVGEHYRENWELIKMDLLGEISDLELAPVTKEVFSEAIDCHTAGRYRACVRLIFPEIEKEVRSSFLNDRSDRPAKIGDFLETASMMTFGDVIRNHWEMKLFEKLTSHLYEDVREHNIQRFLDDPVPNRHAAVHGLIDYGTLKNSVNVIIMAVYTFTIISSLRVRPR